MSSLNLFMGIKKYEYILKSLIPLNQWDRPFHFLATRKKSTQGIKIFDIENISNIFITKKHLKMFNKIINKLMFVEYFIPFNKFPCPCEIY